MAIQATTNTANLPGGATSSGRRDISDREEDRRRMLDELLLLPSVELGDEFSLGPSADNASVDFVSLTIEIEVEHDDLMADFMAQLLALLETLSRRSATSEANCRRIDRLAAHVLTVRQATDVARQTSTRR